MKFLTKYGTYKVIHSELADPIEFIAGQFETEDTKTIDILKGTKFFGVDYFLDSETVKEVKAKK